MSSSQHEYEGAPDSGRGTNLAGPRPDVHMRWANLLFLHWPVRPAAIAAFLPPGVEVDTFGGDAFVALVPFRMEETRFAGVPNLPGLSMFYECNVRTYVKVGPLKAVWFFSLDAQTLLPVLGGRWLWNLNYIHSGFTVRHTAESTDYTVHRETGAWPLRSLATFDNVAGMASAGQDAGAAVPSLMASTRIVWSPGQALPATRPGSLEHFLTERYYLTTFRWGKVKVGRIHHRPWPLRSATIHTLCDGFVPATGLPLGPILPALHSDSIDVIGWKLTTPEAAVQELEAGL